MSVNNTEWKSRNSRPEVFCKMVFLEISQKFAGKYLCRSLFSNKVANLQPSTLSKKCSGTGFFFAKLCKVFKNTFFYRTFLVPASERNFFWSVFSGIKSKYEKIRAEKTPYLDTFHEVQITIAVNKRYKENI